MKIHCEDVARGPGRKFATVPRRVGARKIQAHVIPHDEADYGQRNLLAGEHADADHDGRQRFQDVQRLPRLIQNRDTENLGSSVAESVIDIRNRLDTLQSYLRSLLTPLRAVSSGRSLLS